MKTYPIGRIGGLALTYRGTAVVGYLVLWLALAGLCAWQLRLPWGTALLLGLAAALLHGLSVLVHHLGHAAAARSVGHPMTGIHFWLLLATSEYPADEPPLPAGVHIRRALGGPAASALVSLLCGLVLLLLPAGTLAAWLGWFVFLDNLLVFTLQMFIPLGFNDGGTLWRWLRVGRRG